MWLDMWLDMWRVELYHRNFSCEYVWRFSVLAKVGTETEENVHI